MHKHQSNTTSKRQGMNFMTTRMSLLTYMREIIMNIPMEGRDGDVRFWSVMISSELNKVKY